MTTIKKQWAKNLDDEARYALLDARNNRDRDKARATAQKNKIKTAAKKYNITEDELLSIINKANGICCICTGPLGDRLNIDHCHLSNRVRNVLCSNCNTGLGHFKDDVNILMRAIEYLKLHNS